MLVGCLVLLVNRDVDHLQGEWCVVWLLQLNHSMCTKEEESNTHIHASRHTEGWFTHVYIMYMLTNTVRIKFGLSSSAGLSPKYTSYSLAPRGAMGGSQSTPNETLYWDSPTSVTVKGGLVSILMLSAFTVLGLSVVPFLEQDRVLGLGKGRHHIPMGSRENENCMCVGKGDEMYSELVHKILPHADTLRQCNTIYTTQLNQRMQSLSN